MMKKTLMTILILLTLIAGLSTQPSVASEGHEETGEATHIELLMGEFFFQVEGQQPGDPLVVQAGEQIKLEIINEGKIFHEAMFGFEPEGDHGYHENFFEGVGLKIEHEMLMGDIERVLELEVESFEEVELDPETSITIEFTVPESYAGRTFEIGCFVPGHYEAGMKLTLVVEEGHEALESDADHEDEADEHELEIEDADSDGIPDAEDYCPTFPGKELTNGC